MIFFHFLGLNWSLNDVKDTILVLQKQLMSTKYFLIYTHFDVGGKELKDAYFHPSTVQNPHIFWKKCLFKPTKGMSKNIETEKYVVILTIY